MCWNAAGGDGELALWLAVEFMAVFGHANVRAAGELGLPVDMQGRAAVRIADICASPWRLARDIPDRDDDALSRAS